MTLVSIVLGILSAVLMHPTIAYADPPGVDPCAILFFGGCNPLAGPRIIDNFIQQVASFFVAGNAGFAILFVMIGGAMMMLSFGDESKVSKGKNAIIFALVGFALTLAAQVIVSFVIRYIAATGIYNSTMPGIDIGRIMITFMFLVFNTVFALVAIIAGIRMVMSGGKSDEFGKARTSLVWAIVGALIINVSHAIVRGIFNTGFGG